MKRNKLYKILFCIILTFTFFESKLHGQVTTGTVVTNVNNPTIIAIARINEVFGSSFFSSKPELLQFYKTLLLNRITYKEIPNSPDDKFIKLSSIPLLDLYNSKLSRDLTFNPQTFNPLKYQMDFYAKTTKIYRFDNTNNVIVILPQ